MCTIRAHNLVTIFYFTCVLYFGLDTVVYNVDAGFLPTDQTGSGFATTTTSWATDTFGSNRAGTGNRQSTRGGNRFQTTNRREPAFQSGGRRQRMNSRNGGGAQRRNQGGSVNFPTAGGNRGRGLQTANRQNGGFQTTNRRGNIQTGSPNQRGGQNFQTTNRDRTGQQNNPNFQTSNRRGGGMQTSNRRGLNFQGANRRNGAMSPINRSQNGNRRNRGFLVNNRKDCLMQEWTQWSQPFGFGSVSRERKILRHPEIEGRRCPTDLLQMKETSKKR